MSKRKDKKNEIVERFKLLDLDDSLEMPEEEESEDDDDDDEQQDVMLAPPMPKGVGIKIVALEELFQQESADAFPEMDDVFDKLNEGLKNTSRRIPRPPPVDTGVKRPQPTTKTWTDRYGRQIPIDKMDDDYLINTMRMMLKRAPGTTLRDKLTVLEHTERCWERMAEVADDRKLMDEVRWGFR